MNNWRDRVSNEQCHRRASGRKHINAVRSFHRQIRQREAIQLYCELVRNRGLLSNWGVQSEVARRMGLARSTVSQYLKLIASLTQI
ncbi:MAG: hypothetical protein KME13_23810 [Myxacorys californica WJT36-NPBG1]|nr:hypothetical protein [Myxacorys californica WJT36-NPBG1]